MTTQFRKLLDYLRQPPHDYTPSTQQFLDLNVDKIKRELRLVEEGAQHGAREEPASVSGATGEKNDPEKPYHQRLITTRLTP